MFLFNFFAMVNGSWPYWHVLLGMTRNASWDTEPRTIIHLAMENVQLSNGGETPLLVDHATLCICVYIYVCVRVCVCICVCECNTHIYIYITGRKFCIYIYMFTYISILSYRSIHQSIRPSIHLSMYLSI